MSTTPTIDLSASADQPADASANETAPTAASLELRSVSKVHGEGRLAVQALRGVSLRVLPGELVAVMGPSGSGKSTLLRIAGALDSQTTGSVSVFGTRLELLSIAQRAQLRRDHIGYVFQKLNLISTLTAVENVALPLELAGLRRRAAHEQALAAIGEVGVERMADCFPAELSGGEQQRVAIARALVGERRLVLADEPTGALDSVTGEAVLRLLRARIDAGSAGVLVTHEARHAAWADRTVFLRDGLIVDEVGSDDGERELIGSWR